MSEAANASAQTTGASGAAHGAHRAAPDMARAVRGMPCAVVGAATVTGAQLDTPAVAELLRGERLRSVSLESRLALAAARLALRDAGWDREAIDADELGVVVATRHAGLQEYVDLYRAGMDGERPRVNPARGPQTGLNAPAAELSIRLPAAGPNATVCADADEALRYAADQLAAGRAHAMLVCDVDVDPPVLGGGPDGGAATVVVLEATPAPPTRPVASAVAAGTPTPPAAPAALRREQAV